MLACFSAPPLQEPGLNAAIRPILILLILSIMLTIFLV